MPLPFFNIPKDIVKPNNQGNAGGGVGGSSSGTSIFDSGKYFEQDYNGTLYDVDLYLENSGTFKNPKRFFINPAGVLGLMIRDTVNDWVADGYLTFIYSTNPLPDISSKRTGQPKSTATNGITKAAADNGNTLKHYQFRGDGYDLLRVMIMPKIKPVREDSKGDDVQISKNNTKWMLSYVFSIYDVEDVYNVKELEGLGTDNFKCLKLHFHDLRHQMIQTINLEYSTSEPKDTSLKPNFESDNYKGLGILNTGDVLRDIFNEVIANPTNGGIEEFKIDPSNWDKGQTEIFYTSPASYSAEDDIEYVYGNHVSEKKIFEDNGVQFHDICLLHTERGKNLGSIEEMHLTPISSFFEKAGKEASSPGPLQKEHFFVTSTTVENGPTKLFRAPMGGNNSSDVDFKAFKFGQIMSYSFVDMSPDVNSNVFRTSPVYSVDIKNREFNIEFKGNDIETARKVISNAYIKQLYKKGAEEDLFLPTIHKNKQNLNMFPTFTLNGQNATARCKNTFHNLLYTGLFQNACICFRTLGLSLRESGTFIGIDKTDGCESTDYNNKLYGQWFVVQVNHYFEAGAYMNEIYAIKIHRFEKASQTFEETI